MWKKALVPGGGPSAPDLVGGVTFANSRTMRRGVERPRFTDTAGVTGAGREQGSRGSRATGRGGRLIGVGVGVVATGTGGRLFGEVVVEGGDKVAAGGVALFGGAGGGSGATNAASGFPIGSVAAALRAGSVGNGSGITSTGIISSAITSSITSCQRNNLNRDDLGFNCL